MKQLDLFDYELIDKSKKTKQDIMDKLKHFGIDDMYIKENMQHTYGHIVHLLSSPDPDRYKAYKDALIEELIKIIPLEELEPDHSNMFGKTAIVHHIVDKKDAYNLRTEHQWSPIICLSMIPSEIFEI